MFGNKRSKAKYTNRSQMEYDDDNIPEIDTDDWGDEEFESEYEDDE